MRIEIEQSRTNLSFYFDGKFIGSMKKPKNYNELSENKLLQMFGKAK